MEQGDHFWDFDEYGNKVDHPHPGELQLEYHKDR